MTHPTSTPFEPGTPTTTDRTQTEREAIASLTLQFYRASLSGGWSDPGIRRSLLKAEQTFDLLRNYVDHGTVPETDV